MPIRACAPPHCASSAIGVMPRTLTFLRNASSLMTATLPERKRLEASASLAFPHCGRIWRLRKPSSRPAMWSERRRHGRWSSYRNQRFELGHLGQAEQLILARHCPMETLINSNRRFRIQGHRTLSRAIPAPSTLCGDRPPARNPAQRCERPIPAASRRLFCQSCPFKWAGPCRHRKLPFPSREWTQLGSLLARLGSPPQ